MYSFRNSWICHVSFRIWGQIRNMMQLNQFVCILVLELRRNLRKLFNAFSFISNTCFIMIPICIRNRVFVCLWISELRFSIFYLCSWGISLYWIIWIEMRLRVSSLHNRRVICELGRIISPYWLRRIGFLLSLWRYRLSRCTATHLKNE